MSRAGAGRRASVICDSGAAIIALAVRRQSGSSGRSAAAAGASAANTSSNGMRAARPPSTTAAIQQVYLIARKLGGLARGNGKETHREAITSQGEMESGDGVSIPSPVLWSPENPALYEVMVTQRQGERITEQIRTYVAFRTCGIANGRLTLNGKPYFYHGVLDQGRVDAGERTGVLEHDVGGPLGLVPGPVVVHGRGLEDVSCSGLRLRAMALRAFGQAVSSCSSISRWASSSTGDR